MGFPRALAGTVAAAAVAVTVLAFSGCSNETAAEAKPAPRSVLQQELDTLDHSLHWLSRRGVLVDSYGISGGSLHVGLERHTAPGSDAILRDRIGSLGLAITHGEEVAEQY